MTQDPVKRAAENKSYYRRNREREKARSAKWNRDNPEKVRAKERRRSKRLGSEGQYLRQIRVKYGLTPGQYYDLLGAQNGLCALCGSLNHFGRKLHVDHEHVDGYEDLPLAERAKRVRGLLCSGCNLFLGHAEDDVERVIQRAALIVSNARAYLKR